MVGPLVTWGLFVTWVVHDLEEWLVMPSWGRKAADRLAARFPRAPRFVWSLIRVSRLHATIAIGLVGLVVAWASWAGARSGGRSTFFQIVLIAYGLHALVHLGQSVVARSYTPGVVTAPIIVAPYAWWAWQQINHAGIATTGGAVTWILAVVLLLPVILGAHLIARAVDRLVARRNANQTP